MSPDRRRHRGAHPEDERLFADACLPALRAAVAELSWLLGKGYTLKAALKVVGDRHGLEERQRRAVTRAACSDEQQARRAQRRLPLERARGEECVVDGFNLLITVEAALGGGVVLRCRDGCLRDLASVHGTYRSVEETSPALELIGTAFAAAGIARLRWLLDSPVGNSGRLAGHIRDLAAAHAWAWEIETVASPDAEIARSAAVAITADSNILDLARRWTNFSAWLIEQNLPEAWIIDLTGAE